MDTFTIGPPAWIEWHGRKFYRNNRGYYRSRQRDGTPEVPLHRAVWQEVHGPVPDGHEVHHIDGDPTNNALDNLRVLSRAEHLALHPMDHLPVEARKFWATRTFIERECAVCGEVFRSTGMRALYCSPNCRSFAERRRKGKAIRPVRERLVPITVVCAFCGRTFEHRRSAKVRYCSYKCADDAARARKGRRSRAAAEALAGLRPDDPG